MIVLVVDFFVKKEDSINMQRICHNKPYERREYIE